MRDIHTLVQIQTTSRVYFVVLSSPMTDTRPFLFFVLLSPDGVFRFRHSEPPLDDEGDTAELSVVAIVYDGDWTSVTFIRVSEGNDDSVSAVVEWRNSCDICLPHTLIPPSSWPR